MCVLEAEKEPCLLFGDGSVSLQVLHPMDISNPVLFGPSMDKLIDRHLVLRDIAIRAGDDVILHVGPAAQGPWDDVVEGDVLRIERYAAIDAGPVCLPVKDPEILFAFSFLLDARPAQQGKVAEQQFLLLVRNQPLAEAATDAQPIVEPVLEWKCTHIHGDGSRFPLSDTIQTDNRTPFDARESRLPGRDDLNHGPVIRLLPLLPANHAAAARLLEQDLALVGLLLVIDRAPEGPLFLIRWFSHAL